MWLLGASALAQPPSAAEVPAPPEPSEPDAPSQPSAVAPADPDDLPPPPSAAEPPELDANDADPPPPSAAEVEADPDQRELLAQADLRAPPEPLGPPEPVPPPVPITTETVNAPPLPPDSTSDPDSAFAPAPPPNVDGQPVVVPPPTAAEAPAQPVAAAAPTPAPTSTQPTPPEPPQFRIGALAGVGVTFDHTVGGINPLGFGFGLRGDYLLGDAWRVGARTLYFVGGHSEVPTGTVEMSSWLMAVEGAYAIDLAPITLEPGLALGFFERDRGGPPLFASQSASYIPGSQHHVLTGFYLAPGISGYLPLGELDHDLDLLFVGLDARFDLVFSSSVGANLQLLFELGLRF